jgi:predicted nucleotide-binding protein (sugar kinase/HSP70/actin superfamily)
VTPHTVGVPRSLFFHTEAVLVCSFLESLGLVPVMSPPTDRRIMERGCALAVDETCLPMKIHLGHVDALRGCVDAVLVPRYANLPAEHGEMCVKFWAAHDITRNTFPDLPLLTYNVDRLYGGDTEKGALVAFGRELGATRRQAGAALSTARRHAARASEELVEKQRTELAADSSERTVIVAAHTYILDDEMLGAPVLRLLREQGVSVMRSDRVPDVPELRRRGLEFSPALKWAYNREQLGAVVSMREKIDGIMVLLSFPCGPDSLVSELVQRKVRDIPVCVIVLDELTATGGLQTRVESFCDIVKLREARA